ncbi:MAG: hypothetical protein KC486_27500 [Myxococcales bacterium]|nr:hypothetical protein [Myxococcales bacterium]
MTDAQTLPTGPFEHVAMDYDRLRAAGIRHLERLAGGQWTDYNAHDPGVTILEQLCYAITDLGYRIAHPIADLLAGGDVDVALPGPAAILSCDPVTLLDLRKLVVDVEGVKNAWIEAEAPEEAPLVALPNGGEIFLEAAVHDPNARPLAIAGVLRVLVQTDDRWPAEVVLARVAARLHGQRGLCHDYVVALLTPHEVWVDAKIEVGPVDDPAAVLAEIREALDAELAPPLRFAGKGSAAAEALAVDARYEGPALDHGFIVGEAPPLRRTVRSSDLLHALMNVPAVRAVRSLSLAASATGPRERWFLEIPPGHAPTLATGSRLTLLRAGLPLCVDAAAAQARLDTRRVAARPPARAGQGADERPMGRDRRLAAHRSLLHQFPAAYGVGPFGLPSSAPAERRAQARQLAAYLLLFDQPLANAFAQLARARTLLSPEERPPQTYFAQPTGDPQLDLEGLVRGAPKAQAAWLDDAVERTVLGGDPRERQNRFLCHLLARYAEEIGDHTQIGNGDGATVDADTEALIEDRQRFLRSYPRVSRARGSGHDIFADTDAAAGLVERVRLRLGLRERPRIHLVEHVLLRPVREDLRQISDDVDGEVPLLTHADGGDPWSLRLSFVVEADPNRAADDPFEQMVARTILAETPAHLRPSLHWLADDEQGAHWSEFDAAWRALRGAYRRYREAHLQLGDGEVEDALHFTLRDARDRVIELLGLGLAAPLRDIPLPHRVAVAPGEAAPIRLSYSQRGVLYTLCDERSGAAITADGERVAVEGIGDAIVLSAPPQAARYRILARKRSVAGDDALSRPEAWLHACVEVELREVVEEEEPAP